jgi:hypothetical protein
MRSVSLSEAIGCMPFGVVFFFAFVGFFLGLAIFEDYVWRLSKVWL